MTDSEGTLSILRESTVTVFVNSVAGGGRARFYLTQIQKLFESFHVHAQFVVTESSLELESSAHNAISQGRRALFAMGGDGTFQALANTALRGGSVSGRPPLEEAMILPPRSVCLTTP